MPNRRAILGATLLGAALQVLAADPPRPPVRLRGTIESLAERQLVLRTSAGERVELAIPANLVVTEVYPVTLEAVQQNSFVGVGAMPQADGTQRAIAVLVFPEAQRGTGEGHRPFDFLPQSTMTNATVVGQASLSGTQQLQLRYKDGEKTIVVLPGTPIVSIRPGTRDLLVVGGRVSLTAQELDGRPSVTRVSAGRNGFAPPY